MSPDVPRIYEGVRPIENPEHIPIELVGTLKLGYPLLLYKDKEPTRLSLSRVVEVLCVGPSRGSLQSQAAVMGPQQCQTPPHGRVRSRHVSREGDIFHGVNSDPDPTGERRTPGHTVRTPMVGPGPPRVQAGPLEWEPDPPPRMGSGPPAMESQGPRTEHTRALNRTQAGVQYRRVSRPSLVRTCPHTLLLLVQAETRCCHMAYRA
jgi:hypothetical protein